VVTNEPNITIAVAPALASGLRQRVDVLKSILPGFEGAILVEEDAEMMEQDCRVQWKAGYAEYDAEALWTIIEGIIMRTNLNAKETV
jgi:flagellar biosynthesis/type III secretory pathway protein FliH